MAVVLGLIAMAFALTCDRDGTGPKDEDPRPLDPVLVAEGKDAIAAGEVDLSDPATTLALLELDTVGCVGGATA